MTLNGFGNTIYRRTLSLLSVFAFMGATSYAQFSMNSMDNSTAVALRDPVRQASTDVDAAIYNPAGTAFLEDGFHVSLNGLYSFQPLYSFSRQDDKAVDIHNERITKVSPSVQMAWKKERFSVSVSLANEGSFGKWTCASGSIPFDAFLQALSQQDGIKDVMDDLNTQLLGLNALVAVAGYGEALDVVLEDQYRLGTSNMVYSMTNVAARIGVAYAVNEKFSVSVGAKVNYLTRYSDVHPLLQVYRASSNQSWDAKDYFLSKAILLEKGTETLEGNTQLAGIFRDMATDLEEVQMSTTETNHSGLGMTPIIGADFRMENVNIGAKYEFPTIVNAEDWNDFRLPSNFSLGMDWAILDNLNIAFGGTAYFRTDSDYGHHGEQSPNKVSGNVGLSVSYSPVKKLLLSIGQSYENYSGYWPSIDAEDMEISGRHRFITSLGCAYDFTDKLQLNIGGNIGYAPTVIYNQMTMDIENNGSAMTVNCPVSYYTNMKYNVAVGVNYKF